MKKYYKYILVKLPDTRAFPHASLGSDARRHHLATTPRQWGSLTTAACFILTELGSLQKLRLRYPKLRTLPL